MTDVIGARKVIVLSMLSSGLLLISIQFATNFYPIFILIFSTALFGEAYRPAMMAMVSDYVPKIQTARTMAFIRLALNLGFAGAPAMGGFIAVTIGYSWLFWIDGATCILAGIYFYFVSISWSQSDKLSNEQAGRKDAGELIHPIRNPTYLWFLLATFLMGFSFIQWFQSVPVFIKSEWGFDERYIGILFALSGLLIALIEMPAIHSIEKTNKIRASFLIGLVLLGCSFIPFLLPKALIWCFVAMILMTLGEIFHFPLNTSTAINMTPNENRGGYMAWYWMTWSLTHITGPTVGLGFGFSTFWLFTTFLVGVSLIIFYFLSRKII